MDRRLFLLLVSLAVAANTLGIDAARADDGEDDSSDDDGGSDDDSGDDGGDDSSGEDDSGDDSGGDDSSGGGSDGSGSSGGTGGGTGGTGTSTQGTADHDRARAAVADENALPLRKLLTLFRQSFEGEVVDVTLVKRRSALVYRVKFVDPSGRVRRAEFDAHTGTVLD